MKIFLFSSFLFFSCTAIAQNVGIGNSSPTEKLDVTGNIKADTQKVNVLKVLPNAGVGKVLISDAAGNATWQSSSGLVKAYNGLNKSNDTVHIGGAYIHFSTAIYL